MDLHGRRAPCNRERVSALYHWRFLSLIAAPPRLHGLGSASSFRGAAAAIVRRGLGRCQRQGSGQNRSVRTIDRDPSGSEQHDGNDQRREKPQGEHDRCHCRHEEAGYRAFRIQRLPA